jgi:hypothetical protein
MAPFFQMNGISFQCNGGTLHCLVPLLSPSLSRLDDTVPVSGNIDFIRFLISYKLQHLYPLILYLRMIG